MTGAGHGRPKLVPAPIECVTLPDRASHAARALVAWLAYPDPIRAERAIEWLRSWSARNIIAAGGKPAAPPSLPPNRLWANLRQLEARLRLRLAIGEVTSINLTSSRLKNIEFPNNNFDQDNLEHFEAMKNARKTHKNGGKLPPLKFGNINIIFNVPPIGSRALARYISSHSGRDEHNEVRRLFKQSRPVTHLAVGGHASLTHSLIRNGLAYVCFNGDWVPTALRTAEIARQELIDSSDFPFIGPELIRFEWAGLKESPIDSFSWHGPFFSKSD